MAEDRGSISGGKKETIKSKKIDDLRRAEVEAQKKLSKTQEELLDIRIELDRTSKQGSFPDFTLPLTAIGTAGAAFAGTRSALQNRENVKEEQEQLLKRQAEEAAKAASAANAGNSISSLTTTATAALAAFLLGMNSVKDASQDMLRMNTKSSTDKNEKVVPSPQTKTKRTEPIPETPEEDSLISSSPTSVFDKQTKAEKSSAISIEEAVEKMQAPISLPSTDPIIPKAIEEIQIEEKSPGLFENLKGTIFGEIEDMKKSSSEVLEKEQVREFIPSIPSSSLLKEEKTIIEKSANVIEQVRETVMGENKEDTQQTPVITEEINQSPLESATQSTENPIIQETTSPESLIETTKESVIEETQKEESKPFNILQGLTDAILGERKDTTEVNEEMIVQTDEKIVQEDEKASAENQNTEQPPTNIFDNIKAAVMGEKKESLESNVDAVENSEPKTLEENPTSPITSPQILTKIEKIEDEKKVKSIFERLESMILEEKKEEEVESKSIIPDITQQPTTKEIDEPIPTPISIPEEEKIIGKENNVETKTEESFKEETKTKESSNVETKESVETKTKESSNVETKESVETKTEESFKEETKTKESSNVESVVPSDIKENKANTDDVATVTVKKESTNTKESEEIPKPSFGISPNFWKQLVSLGEGNTELQKAVESIDEDKKTQELKEFVNKKFGSSTVKNTPLPPANEVVAGAAILSSIAFASALFSGSSKVETETTEETKSISSENDSKDSTQAPPKPTSYLENLSSSAPARVSSEPRGAGPTSYLDAINAKNIISEKSSSAKSSYQGGSYVDGLSKVGLASSTSSVPKKISPPEKKIAEPKVVIPEPISAPVPEPTPPPPTPTPIKNIQESKPKPAAMGSYLDQISSTSSDQVVTTLEPKKGMSSSYLDNLDNKSSSASELPQSKPRSGPSSYLDQL